MSKNHSIRAIIGVALLAVSISVWSIPVGLGPESDAEPSEPAFTLQSETALAAAADAVPVVSAFAPSAKPAEPQRPDRQALASENQADGQAALSLTLWTFARAIQAQQQGSPFEVLQTSLALQEFQITPQADITAVPLPGAVWLFVMGLLGLAGSRVTRMSGREAETATRGGMRPAGGLVPA